MNAPGIGTTPRRQRERSDCVRLAITGIVSQCLQPVGHELSHAKSEPHQPRRRTEWQVTNCRTPGMNPALEGRHAIAAGVSPRTAPPNFPEALKGRNPAPPQAPLSMKLPVARIHAVFSDESRRNNLHNFVRAGRGQALALNGLSAAEQCVSREIGKVKDAIARTPTNHSISSCANTNPVLRPHLPPGNHPAIR